MNNKCFQIIGIILLLFLIYATIKVSNKVRCLGYHRQSKNNNTNIKIVSSFTTTPIRIKKIYDTLNCFLNQTIKPERVILNLPERFSRTGERYMIPDDLTKIDRLVINQIKDDYGPITKLVGAVLMIPKNQDVWILVHDDDHLYPQETLEIYLKYIQSSKNKYAYSGHGFIFDLDYNNLDNSAVKYTSEKNTPVNVLEGFMTFCVHRSFFDEDFVDYINFCNTNLDCRLSDDIIISNYLAMKRVGIKYINDDLFNISLFYEERCVLEYGYETDALHQMAKKDYNNDEKNVQLGGHFPKYIRVLKFLSQNGILYL